VHVLFIHPYFSTRSGSDGTRSFEFARRWIGQGRCDTMLAGVADCLAIVDVNARRLAEERFSRDLLSDQMLDVLRRTVEGERA